MNELKRKVFEEKVYPNFGPNSSAYGLKRYDSGEYKNEVLEDHWQTFQDGWEYATQYFFIKDKENYSYSDGGMDPR